MADFFTQTSSDLTYGYDSTRAEIANELFRKVYGYMAMGLILTSLTAYFTASSRAMLEFFFSSGFPMMIVAVAEIGLVIFLSAAINKIEASTALICFAAYSILNGILCSSVLLVYTQESVHQAFFTTAGMFGAMSVYGLFTKRDLTSWGSFLTMGLFGIIIASVINLFFGSVRADFVISILGIIIFLGLTAWDTWKIKNLANEIGFDSGSQSAAVSKIAIIGALALYLDFVNIFLYLVRLFGRRK